MAYTQTAWNDGDVITADKLNNAEQGIADANALAATNETDIDQIDHLVTALASDTEGTVKLNPSIVGISNLKTTGSAVVGAALVVASGKEGIGFANVPAPVYPVAVTVPTTLSAIKVAHLRKFSTGYLSEHCFDIVNSGSTAATIKANTVFATGAGLAAKAVTYDCLDMATGDSYTLSVNATGASLSFTTDIAIPANGSMHIYVRAK